MALVNDSLFVARLGPYGQAVEVRPPGDPYKPMDVTLYNAMVSASFADTICQTFFGFKPPLELPGEPPATSPLVDAATPRGLHGVLKNVVWHGALHTIVSDAQGLHLT